MRYGVPFTIRHVPPPHGSGQGATSAARAEAPCYAVPILSSCRISITGFVHQKAELHALIENHGGKHSADLTRDCTHLISDGAPSAKLRCVEMTHDLFSACVPPCVLLLLRG